MDKETYAKGWLRAFFDGEGCAVVGARLIDFANTEPSVIAAAQRHLRVLGIGCRCFHSDRRPPRKPIAHLKIARRHDVMRFIELVGSDIPYKQDRLALITAWFTRPNQPYRNRWFGPRPPSKAAVARLRKKGLTRAQIATEIGVSVNSLSHYIASHGLSGPYRKGERPTADELRSAYHGENLTLDELGRKFGYRGKNIVKLMKVYGIERRGPGRREGIPLSSCGRSTQLLRA